MVIEMSEDYGSRLRWIVNLINHRPDMQRLVLKTIQNISLVFNSRMAVDALHDKRLVGLVPTGSVSELALEKGEEGWEHELCKTVRCLESVLKWCTSLAYPEALARDGKFAPSCHS